MTASRPLVVLALIGIGAWPARPPIVGNGTAARRAFLQASGSPKADSGLILGRVVEAGSGEPVRGALVETHARGTQDSPQAVLTDKDGQFVFSGLPAGEMFLGARKTGYSGSSYGQRRPHGNPIPLALGQHERRADVTIYLWKLGAITGTVTDENGDPLMDVSLRAYPRMLVGGRAVLGGPQYGGTDDRGVYRIAHLVAQDYVVAIWQESTSAPASLVEGVDALMRAGDRNGARALASALMSAHATYNLPGTSGTARIGAWTYGLREPAIAPRGDVLFVYPLQYAGGAPTASAARVITVRTGQDSSGVDFVARPARTYRISGRIVDENGPVARMPIRLMPSTGDEFWMELLVPAHTTISDDQGRFMVPGVTPGDYVLRVLKGPGGSMGFEGGVSISAGGSIDPGTRLDIAGPTLQSHTRFATLPVGVTDRDIDDLTLTVHNGARLSGRVEFAGSHTPPDMTQVTRTLLGVERRDGRLPGWDFEMTGTVGRDGQFRTVELPPGSYFLRANQVPAGWTLESVMLGGRDISDVPVEVTDTPITSIVVRLTDQPSILSGTVHGATRDERRDERLDGAIVVAFPTDRNGWIDFGGTPRRLQDTTVSRDGAFSLRGLPAGEYFVAAVHDDFVTEWRQPEFLQRVAQTAQRVRINAGEQRLIELTLSPPR